MRRAALVLFAAVLASGCSLSPDRWYHDRTTLSVADVRPQQIGSKVAVSLKAEGRDLVLLERGTPFCRNVESGTWMHRESGTRRNGPGFKILSALVLGATAVAFIVFAQAPSDNLIMVVPIAGGAGLGTWLWPLNGGGQTEYRTRVGKPGSRWQDNRLDPCPPSAPTVRQPLKRAEVKATFPAGQTLYWTVSPKDGAARVAGAAASLATVASVCGAPRVDVRVLDGRGREPKNVGGAPTWRSYTVGNSLTIKPGSVDDLPKLKKGSREEAYALACEKKKIDSCVASNTSRLSTGCAEECRERAGAFLCTMEADDCRVIASDGLLDCSKVYNACLYRRRADDASVAACRDQCIRDSTAVTCRLRTTAAAPR